MARAHFSTTSVSTSKSARSTSAVVVAVSGFSFFNAMNIATTGTQVFGQFPPQNVQNMGEPVWNDFAFNVLRADFDVQTDFVQIDLIFRDDDVAALRAFASDGTLIHEVVGSGDGRTANAFHTATINRATADIAYVTAGGVGGEGAFLDNFSFNRIDIPEPGTLALFGLGLVGLGFTRLRRAA